MQFKLYTDVYEFYNDTYGMLMRHEAQKFDSSWQYHNWT